MSIIEVTRHHTLNHQDAVDAATHLAASLSDQYGVKYYWEGNSLIFQRSGVKGVLHVKPTQVHIRMELGFFVRAFSSRIEKSIHNHLDKLIG